MDLTSLMIFRAVTQELSVTRAAEMLGRVPSNVTTRIQQLEAEVGVPLFQRDKKRIALTREGEIYLDYANRILNLADEARQVVNPAGPSGVLRIGAMESTVASRLPLPLARYNQRWPHVTLDISTAPSRQLSDAVSKHRLDCAFIAAPSDEWWVDFDELERAPVFREQLVLLLPPGHPAVNKPDDIKPRSLAAFAHGCTYRALADKWLGDRSQSKFVVQEVKSYHAMIACTSGGSCISVMPRSVVDLIRHLAPIEEKPLMAVDTFLVWRQGFVTPAFTEFRNTLAEFTNIKEKW